MNNKWRIIKGCICLFLSVIFALLTSILNGTLYDLASLFALVFSILSVNYVFFSPEIKRKIAKKVEKFFVSLTEKIIGFAQKIAEKFYIRSGRNFKGLGLIHGYTDDSVRINPAKVTKKSRKRKKFRNMDNVEKVRFIYEKRVNTALRKGMPIDESMTPNQIGRVMDENKYTEVTHELIEVYNESRYNDFAEISGEMVKTAQK